MTFLHTALHEEVRQALLEQGVPAFDRKRRVADLVQDALEGLGAFYRTTDGRRYFFSRLERHLYDLDDEPSATC